MQVAAAAAAAAVVATSAEQVHWTWTLHTVPHISLCFTDWKTKKDGMTTREATRSHFIIPVLFKHLSLLWGCQVYTARWILCAYLDLHKHVKEWCNIAWHFCGSGHSYEAKLCKMCDNFNVPFCSRLVPVPREVQLVEAALRQKPINPHFHSKCHWKCN